MVDEQSCIQEVQNLIRTFRGSDRHRWLEIFLKTEEYLQENSLKQKLSILDALRTYILKNGDFAALLNEDDLQTVISIWCTIYLGSLRNLKLCQKVRKIFIAISNFKPSHTEYEMKRNIRQLLSLQMSEHVSSIEAICQLIDICDLGQKCVQDLFDHFLATISHCLDSFCQELQCTEGGELLTVHNTENCQGFLKAALKTFQYFPSEIKHLLSGEPPNSVDHGNLAEILQTFISNLWKVLFCEDFPKECTLLCGTAVGLLLGIICTELKILVSTRESIIQLLLVADSQLDQGLV
ncbi:uncharacterized protein [Porites lutea]|uniref:uncharacterized protein n=1 Tax=Porites lutea TaxID=51062 RepID=UPI003CC5F948